MYLLTDINTKQFCKRNAEKYFAPLRISYLFIESSINPFVDISLTFFDSSCNSFSDFVLIEVTFYLESFSLLSKSASLTKSAISSSVGNFACANLFTKLCAVSLLNS